MYLLYVDESGDVGLPSQGSPTRFFVLSGLVVHELRWRQLVEAMLSFRQDLRARYGLKLRDEIHAAHFLHSPGELQRIPKSLRLRILREVVDFQAGIPDINVLNILVDKTGKSPSYDVFDNAWQALIQRFHNTLSHRNFPGPQNAEDLGMLVVDNTDEKRLRLLTRRMRKYNPVPNTGGGGFRQILLTTLLEDAVHRDSLHSYFIQTADVNAYLLLQREMPCGYVRKKGGKNYFERLAPVLCTVASRSDPMGIVRL